MVIDEAFWTRIILSHAVLLIFLILIFLILLSCDIAYTFLFHKSVGIVQHFILPTIN